VRDLLLSVEGVEALHSLHIWALTVAQPVLSVHIAIGKWLRHSEQGKERGSQRPRAISECFAKLLHGAL
jgi:Co/Zn/Cd efflux system component